MKSKNFIIPLVVFPFDVMISIGETDDQLKKALNKYEGVWEDDMSIVGQARFIINNKNQSIIRTLKYPDCNADFGVIQHEIFHAVTFIMDRMGMKLRLEKSCEAYAYLTQYLTEKIYDQL